ncbi:hypothetical protein [Psychrobacter sp. AOP31-A1-22]|uniref:hypothetical protein n=1 Tax=Psychrobacter sp. AOP31-A1-22 TaxID=3457696 RepID=UPI0040369CA8
MSYSKTVRDLPLTDNSLARHIRQAVRQASLNDLAHNPLVQWQAVDEERVSDERINLQVFLTVLSDPISWHDGERLVDQASVGISLSIKNCSFDETTQQYTWHDNQSYKIIVDNDEINVVTLYQDEALNVVEGVAVLDEAFDINDDRGISIGAAVALLNNTAPKDFKESIKFMLEHPNGGEVEDISGKPNKKELSFKAS